MLRPSPGPSWTVLPGNVPLPPSPEPYTAHPMQEPPGTSPAPTVRSDVDLLDDNENINLNPPPVKRKAIHSPSSLPRPPKVARFNDSDHRERRAQASPKERPNISAPGSLTQAPNAAKTSRLSFLSQPTSVPPAPGKGKNRASSRQSTSSLSDHVSNMVERHSIRFRRVETARKMARKRRVTTTGLIRDVLKSSSGSEISSAATRVRRASGIAIPRVRPFLSRDVIEVTDSSDSTRRNRVYNDDPIIISSSDADTPPRLPKPSQKSGSRSTGPRSQPLPDTEVICITDSDDDIVPTLPPATAIPALPRVAVVPGPSPATVVPPIDIHPPLSPPGAAESVHNNELLDNEPTEYWYLGPDDDQAPTSSELHQEAEEYMYLNPPKLDSADQVASRTAQEESNITQDLPLPALDSPTSSTLPVSKQASDTSLNDDVPVRITSQLSGAENCPRLESFTDSQTSMSKPHPHSQPLSPTALQITNKPSVTWKHTPVGINPFFARALSLNSKVLNKHLPTAQRSSEPTVPAAVMTSPAAIPSSTDVLPKSLMDEQPPNVLGESNSTVLLHSPPTSPSADDDRSVLLPAADNSIDSSSMEIVMDSSGIPVPLVTVPPSSVPIPVPPRVPRSTPNLTLTELINRTREEHLQSRFVDLTGEVSPSSGENLAPGTFTSQPHEPVQLVHPVLSNETRTPNIQEIRNLVRQRSSSSKLGTSLAATNPSAPSAATKPSVSSAASSTSSPSIASAASPPASSHSPPRSSASNSATSTTHGSSKSSSRQKNRAMNVASLEMYISPIAGAFQTPSSKKTRTPRSGKRMSCGADRFKSIITPTADTAVRSQSLSPSEGRRPKHAVGSHGLPTDVRNDTASGTLPSPPTEIRVPPELYAATPTTSPSAISLDQETPVQKVGAEMRHTKRIYRRVDHIPRPESIQGVTESIASLDLHEDSRSPDGDIDVDHVRRLSLENDCEGAVQSIPVSVQQMEQDETADKISDREECMAVLMQLEVSDGEVGDAGHPISITSSRTASSHTSSRRTPEFAEPFPVAHMGGQSLAASIRPLEDGVESYMGGYPIITWKSYSDAQRRRPPKYNLAKDLPYELQDRVNALPQSFRNSNQARLLFEATIDEAMDDDLNSPPISVINDVTDEGAPPWEFVYTNKMWYGEGVPPPDIKNLKSCDCVGRCDPKSKTCSCAKRQRQHLKEYIDNTTIPKTWNGAPFVYDSKGCLQWFGMPIFECNAFCACDEDCPNRVVQNGRRYVVNIKRTENKGWGVFNGQKKIPKGSFIGVYAGELLPVSEADHRGTLYNKFGRTYLFDIDFHHIGSEAIYSVDAYHAGNFTRFLNHSCDPNCEIQACYIDEANIKKPMLTVFTIREVEPLEELSFSYTGHMDDDPVNNPKVSNDAVFATCRCGSANCQGVLFSGL